MKRRPLARIGLAVLGVVVLLFLPPCPHDPPPERPDGSFAWNADATFEQLAARFDATGTCPADIESRGAALKAELESLSPAPPNDPRWADGLQSLFELAADSGRCEGAGPQFLEVRNALWRSAKAASVRWDDSQQSRQVLYKLLYGSRAAAEALLLQLPAAQAPTLNLVEAVHSVTPSLEYEGVRIHSGDLLVSRGGAPTSAFIARGNDYPGNFSHVAVVHVDDDGTAAVIEAHIEKGVAIATPHAYFADKKLRVLVLRMRPDHPAMRADPTLPHRAAQAALDEAKARHIPYDFEMDFADPHEQFCSEVASTHYADLGVTLWPTLSTFSSEGLARWMAAFGVTHFETHSPSDLEYDPALAVVAEWHDHATLMDDHVDNAVIDIMLEEAQDGAPLDYSYAMLPLARVAKAYSWVLNRFGKVGPVPEGMSPVVALRATWLADEHARRKAALEAAASSFEAEHGRPPAYWELVELARNGVSS
ncbi:MAG: YiiX/YebB-like N1pC/P60 family cysteine hydrolase [Nannocystaceae bacterium]|nr:YiiX/YebB-like N1pC/P60 family cysteine hydrolase [bacterium]